MNHILSVENLSKSYRYYRHEFFRVLSWFGFPIKPKQEIHVLKNISLHISAGETIGLLGQNGAGKSTLLKLIAGTIKPTSGSINVTGSVAAILELGMGFNPEFTGRQNAYHACSILGKSRAEVDAVIGEIEKFAEIGAYFDAPARTYSSGMMVRVAFSVATAFRPDVLIIDEALSVGDTYFQQKSFSRIKEFQKQGTSLILVSHDKTAILELCSRAILIEKGQIAKQGSPQEITDYYNALIAEKALTSSIRTKSTQSGAVQTISGTGEAEVIKITLLDCNQKPILIVDAGEEVTLRVLVQANHDISNLVFGLLIKNRLGQDVYGTNTFHTKNLITNLLAADTVEISVSFKLSLGLGSYSVTTSLFSSEHHLQDNYEWRDHALQFDVVNQSSATFIGSCKLEPKITIDRNQKPKDLL